MSKQKDKAEFSAKIKLLKIYELLRKETDENHPMSRTELCRRLNEERISSNVRTLSKDIEVLNLYGYEVQSFINNHERFFYIPEFEFSVPEVKILIDAVQAASFITESKTKDLVDKIANLSGSSRGALLKKNMVCFNTRKHNNEKILYNVDRLEDAISRNKKASFFYFDLDEYGKRVYRSKSDGEKKRYFVEPISLIFYEDNYYLMTYSRGNAGSHK